MNEIEVQQALTQLAEIDEQFRKVSPSTGIFSLLGRKQRIIDSLITATGLIPYWTLDGYKLRSIEEYNNENEC